MSNLLEGDRDISRYAYFPAALPDELPYSMVARYKRLLGMRFDGIFKKDLGLPATMSAASPFAVDRFVSHTQPKHVRPGGFLTSHTTYPYISAFMDKDERAVLRTHCLRGFGKNTLVRGQSRTTRQVFAFCASCVAADVRASGQAGWRRVHQLMGVFVCPWHETLLRTAGDAIRTTEFRSCPVDPKSGWDLPCPVRPDVALAVARMSRELIENPVPAAQRSTFALRMRRLVLSSGWDRGRTQVSAKFEEHVIDRCGEPQAWGSRSRRLLRERLGVIWSRDAGDVGSAYPASLVLFTLAVLGCTLTDLNAAHGDAEPPDSAPVSVKAAHHCKSAVSPMKTKWHRDKVAAFLLASPTSPRTEIWRLNRASCLYLMRNDRTWIASMMPPPAYLGRMGEMDATFSAQVPDAVSRLLAAEEHPRRITVTRLRRELRPGGFSATTMKSMPLTADAISKCCESVEAVARRRLVWTAAETVRAGTRVVRTRFLERVFPPKSLRLFAHRVFGLVEESLLADDPVAYFQSQLLGLTGDLCRAETDRV